MAGWGDIFGKIGQQFQSRIERLKNERVNLIVERERLYKLECTGEVAKKIAKIEVRISQIDDILINNAKD